VTFNVTTPEPHRLPTTTDGGRYSGLHTFPMDVWVVGWMRFYPRLKTCLPALTYLGLYHGRFVPAGIAWFAGGE